MSDRVLILTIKIPKKVVDANYHIFTQWNAFSDCPDSFGNLVFEQPFTIGTDSDPSLRSFFEDVCRIEDKEVKLRIADE